jgi:hypothetical protein
MKDFLFSFLKDLIFLILMLLMLRFVINDLKSFTLENKQKTIICKEVEKELICNEQ